MKRSSAPRRSERNHPEAAAESARPTEGLHEVDFGLPAGRVPLEAAGEAFDELCTASALLTKRFELLDPENCAACRDVAELDVCEAMSAQEAGGSQTLAMERTSKFEGSLRRASQNFLR